MLQHVDGDPVLNNSLPYSLTSSLTHLTHPPLLPTSMSVVPNSDHFDCESVGVFYSPFQMKVQQVFSVERSVFPDVFYVSGGVGEELSLPKVRPFATPNPDTRPGVADEGLTFV